MSTRQKKTDSARSHSGAEEILSILAKTYPEARCFLDFKNPLQLLIATILAAQCTDARVNQVTPALFKKYPTAKDFATARPEELEQDIRSTGFFRQKTKSIIAVCKELAEKHKGQVPADIDILTNLRGVGRKTANVVLGTAMGLPTGIVVDTHVKRLAFRMGLSEETDPEKIERDLMKVVPEDQWIDFGHRMTEHGRKICVARKPKCEICPLDHCCPKKE